MVKPHCPHCNAQVAIFSKEWQAQRKSKIKACPSCGKTVVVAFDGKTYLRWLVAATPIMLISYFIFGFGGFRIFLPAAVALPLFPSLRLSKK